MRAALAAAALGLLVLAAGASATTQQEVEEALTCQCGCGLTVHACNHLQCPSGEPMKKEIAERLNIPIGTVKSRHHAALQALRRRVERLEGGAS